jgi:hypothetical protein
MFEETTSERSMPSSHASGYDWSWPALVLIPSKIKAAGNFGVDTVYWNV